MTTSNRVELIAVEIDHDYNAAGQRKWLVTPIFRRDGRILSVPDDRGWDTEQEALDEARATRDDHRRRGTLAHREPC